MTSPLLSTPTTRDCRLARENQGGRLGRSPSSELVGEPGTLKGPYSCVTSQQEIEGSISIDQQDGGCIYVNLWMLQSAIVWCCLFSSLHALDMCTSSAALSIADCMYLSVCVSFTLIWPSLSPCVCTPLCLPPVIRSGSAHISPVVIVQQCPLFSGCLWSQQELQHSSGRDGERCGVHRTC